MMQMRPDWARDTEDAPGSRAYETEGSAMLPAAPRPVPRVWGSLAILWRVVLWADTRGKLSGGDRGDRRSGDLNPVFVY